MARICETIDLRCVECGYIGKGILYYDKPLLCPECSEVACIRGTPIFGEAPGLATDDIPGGVEIRHGLVNEDGTPRRFYSKTDIKVAANEQGLKWADDTPGKPYKVRWSGKQRPKEEVKPIG